MVSGKRLKDDSRPKGGKPTLDNVGNNCVQNSSHKIVNTKTSNGGEKKLNGRNTSGKDEDTSL